MDTQPLATRGFRPGTIAAGVLLLAFGAAMLLDTTGVAHLRFGGLIAPLVLISIGVSSLLNDDDAVVGPERTRRRRCSRRSAASGFWMIGVGIWMLASQNHLFGLTFATSWPILVILSGVMIVIRGVR